MANKTTRDFPDGSAGLDTVVLKPVVIKHLLFCSTMEPQVLTLPFIQPSQTNLLSIVTAGGLFIT